MDLKEVYPDVLYANPRMKGDDGRPAKWSLQRGLTVKRKGRAQVRRRCSVGMRSPGQGIGSP